MLIEGVGRARHRRCWRKEVKKIRGKNEERIWDWKERESSEKNNVILLCNLAACTLGVQRARAHLKATTYIWKVCVGGSFGGYVFIHMQLCKWNHIFIAVSLRILHSPLEAVFPTLCPAALPPSRVLRREPGLSASPRLTAGFCPAFTALEAASHLPVSPSDLRAACRVLAIAASWRWYSWQYFHHTLAVPTLVKCLTVESVGYFYSISLPVTCW